MSSPKYIKSLDGIRAIAALLVLIFHYSQYVIFSSDWGKLFQKIGYLGQTGVSLFFVLSGFLITRILFDQIQSPHYWKNFIIRRSLRIFPLYFLYLTCEYFIVPYLTHTPQSRHQFAMVLLVLFTRFCHHIQMACRGAKTFLVISCRGTFLPSLAIFCSLLQNKTTYSSHHCHHYHQCYRSVHPSLLRLPNLFFHFCPNG